MLHNHSVALSDFMTSLLYLVLLLLTTVIHENNPIDFPTVLPDLHLVKRRCIYTLH